MPYTGLHSRTRIYADGRHTTTLHASTRHPQQPFALHLTTLMMHAAGDWVLANRPAAVVVETACTPEHGAQPGRGVTCRDQVQGAFVCCVVSVVNCHFDAVWYHAVALLC